jgi:hypothetical protein
VRDNQKGAIMSRKKEEVTEPVTEEKETSEAEAETISEVAEKLLEKAKEAESVVYCGPSIRGVARQYTVYTGAIPEALTEFIQSHPAAKALLVPTEKFAATRANLEKAGSAEAILYKTIKSEL